MHEFSICERLVEAVLKAQADLGPADRGTLKTVHVVAGGLHQIVPDYMDVAYEVLTKDTAAAGSGLQLRVTPVTGKCRGCGWEGTIVPPIFQCADCEAFEIDVTGGKELYLERMEVEQG